MRQLKMPLCGLALLFAVASCDKETVDAVSETENAVEPTVKLELTDEVVSTFKKNFFNVGEVKVIDFHLPDGTVEQRYQLEDDIVFSAEQYENLVNLKDTDGKNYHTNNLVSSPRTLTIIGYTGGGGFALSNKERTALQWAVNNYNRLNLDISLDLSYGSNFQDKDLVVYNNTQNNPGRSGGVAGFPSGGDPNQFIQIYGLSNFSTNANEHVITHEIGHSIGFRHTDWFSRQSCGENTNEGVGSIGANPIPGTPEGYDSTSLMLACFSSGTDGEFNNNDVTALRYLY